jgi:hypothetical protein
MSGAKTSLRTWSLVNRKHLLDLQLEANILLICGDVNSRVTIVKLFMKINEEINTCSWGCKFVGKGNS